MRGRLQPERKHLGVGRRLVGPPEGFDAGLQEFGGCVAAVTEHRAEIAVARRLAGERRGEIVARHRNREVGTQAEFAAAGGGGQIHALADVLAREVEERLGRLQDGGRNAGVAGALIGSDQRLRPRVGPFRLRVHARVHRFTKPSIAAAFSTITLRIRRCLMIALNETRGQMLGVVNEFYARPRAPLQASLWRASRLRTASTNSSSLTANCASACFLR